MKRLAVLTSLVSLAAGLVSAGTDTPRKAGDFPNHKRSEGIIIGARLLSEKEVKKAFFTDLHKKCLIVEVAVEPDSGKSVRVSRDQFKLRQTDVADELDASSPEEVSRVFQKEARSATGVAVTPRREAGYRTGNPRIDGTDPYDPINRQKGYYTRDTVDVTWGNDATGADEVVRKTLETELTKKELPLGRIQKPVFGYLYFPKPEKTGRRFELELATDAGTVALALKR